MKIGIAMLAVIILLAGDSFSQVVINEISAANRTHFQDNYGEEEDWVELYNTGAADFDLSGYYLSDVEDNLTKWEFPAGAVISAGGYMILVANDRNEYTGGFYHTSYRISQDVQEGAVLSDPSGTIIDSYLLTNPNQLDHSRGRVTDGAGSWGVFLTPSPGAANTGAISEYAAKPVLTDGGIFGGGLNVEMTTSSTNASIRYTLDGFEPTLASLPYAGPVFVGATAVVRARVFSNDPNIPPSLVETNSYLINTNHTLPIISVSGTQLLTLLGGQQIDPIGHLEYFSPQGILLAESSGEFNEHGNDSWAYPQRGIDYITRDEFGNGHELHYPIFRTSDRQDYQRLIIKAAASDNYPFEQGGAHIRDAYVQSLSQLAELRMDERSYEPCVMYVNGQYWGVYDLREKVDDHDFTRIYYDQGKYDIDFLKTWGGTWEEYGSGADWDDLRNFILGNDMTDPANYAYVDERYNTGSLIDYFVLNSYIVCVDWLNWNTGWWRGRNPDGDKRKWRYILWDMDASFGHYVNFTGVPDQSANANICDPEQLGDPGGQGHVPIWNTLLNNETFFADYINRYSDLASNHFSCEFMIQHLDSLVGLLEPEMPQHINRWGGSMAEWEGNVQEIRDFINERCAIINNSFLDCYEELDGPYNITFYADPPEGGSIQLPSIEIETYPYDVTYFGGINAGFEAQANDGFTFSHWTSNNTVFAPNELTEEIVVNFTADDTLTAHFNPDVLYNLTLNVSPPNTGNIVLNGTTYNSFPITVQQYGSVNNDLAGQPIAGWGFEIWQSSIGLNEPANQSEVTFVLESDGSITAVFYEIIYDVQFNVMPPETGAVVFEDEILEALPENRMVPGDIPLSVKTYPIAPFHEFSHWSVLNGSPLPDEFSPEIELNFASPDVVIANYVELPNYPLILDVNPRNVGCWIKIPDTLVKDFPYEKQILGDKTFIFEAIPRGNYEFSHWEVVYGVDVENENVSAIQYKLYSPTRLVAHFTERINAVFIPNSFTPNEDGFNDIFKVYGMEIDPNDFKLVIMSRWGGELFSTTDMNQGWNGGKEGSNYYAPPGLYAYFIHYRNTITGDIVEKAGQILLIR